MRRWRRLPLYDSTIPMLAVAAGGVGPSGAVNDSR
jgi:hypothetical protein